MFLADRYIKVEVGNKLSSLFKQEEGVPQGSVLSVTLFSIAINKITNEVCPPVSCSLFVDDFALYCTSYNAVEACSFLQAAIDRVSRWADRTGFKFSSLKTIAVRFTRSRRIEPIPTLTMKGIIIPYEDQVKFLGMTFDKRLTWGPHIDNLKVKVKKSLNILKVVSSFDWGADRKTLIRLYDSLCRSKLDYGCQIYSSACKSKLKELDVVHNLGLRICTGAFRTSPVESIYVDAGELPLHLRREELGLRYIQRIKSNPKNPSIKVLGDCNSTLYTGPRSSKPFQVRINEEVHDPNVKRQKIKEISYPKYPPWLMPKLNICPKIVTKKNSTDNCHHSSHTRVFTDGSKSAAGVGAAVLTKGTLYQSRLSSNASVCTAELTAITSALSKINERDELEYVIYMDSYSSIRAIEQFNPFHPLVQKVQEWLYRLHMKYKKVHFCWIPSHVGILQNEIVDEAAKEASLASKIDFKYIPHCDMKRPIKQYINTKWKEKWSSPSLANNKKYKKIRPSVEFWTSSFHTNRKHEKVLTRLRIGHTRLTHGFLFEGSSPPVCDCCQVQLTVEHILVDCKRYDNSRTKYHIDEKSIDILLNEDIDVDNVMNFLKEIGLYYEF